VGIGKGWLGEGRVVVYRGLVESADPPATTKKKKKKVYDKKNLEKNFLA